MLFVISVVINNVVVINISIIVFLIDLFFFERVYEG